MNVFVARQPILDRKGMLVGYELLFREGLDNYFQTLNGDQATGRLISSSFFSMGIEQFTGGKKAFINFTDNLLKCDIATILPQDSVIIEILETVEPDPEIIEACKNLKKAGYQLALDDFVLTPAIIPLLQYADIIKVDFLATRPEHRRVLCERLGGKVKFLAEKVETVEAYQEALGIGYQYFQGYYFSKPVIIEGKDISLSQRNALRLLKEVYREEFDIEYIEQIIKADVSLSYKLIKFINSSFFGFKSKISSIRQALALLGHQELKKWVSLITMGNINEEKPHELVVEANIRATFAEALALELGLGEKSSEAFLMGLFSVIDAVLDQPMNDICKVLPLSDDIIRAFQGSKNVYRDILDLIICYEKGDWLKLNDIVNELNLVQMRIPQLYVQSLKKADLFIAQGIA
ncbi:EAL and HDOD domain-containing protein [Desulfitobacterium sp.]|uniref:EAL and HDOD domain-containing protein n=1 Tax=Desulfitobacterium sp. TaxID=49981 RepID=UPI002B20B996|nr:HDOD domain-containing protein [Desulfitobacterium sp.]MEA4900416.1 HDOD domain-containing protein [Desulfitobacterium sp.]